MASPGAKVSAHRLHDRRRRCPDGLCAGHGCAGGRSDGDTGPCVKGTSGLCPAGATADREGDVPLAGQRRIPRRSSGKQFFAKYQEAYPNITVQYDAGFLDEISKIVPLGIQNGNLHDVFSIPQASPTQAYTEGWLMPLRRSVARTWRKSAKYPPGSFVEGINVFDGKTYCLPTRRASAPRRCCSTTRIICRRRATIPPPT